MMLCSQVLLRVLAQYLGRVSEVVVEKVSSDACDVVAKAGADGGGAKMYRHAALEV